MGAWGPGNFENDYAADRLIDLCEPLLKQVEEAFADPLLLEPDEAGSSVVVANLEIIACLSEHLGRYARGDIEDVLYPCVLPAPAVIADWKTRYLAIWDDGIDGLDPDPEYKTTRREVIVETFDRVGQLAHLRHDQ